MQGNRRATGVFADALYGLWKRLIDKGQEIQFTMLITKTLPFHQVYFKTAMLKILDQRTVRIEIINIHINGQWCDKDQGLFKLAFCCRIMPDLIQFSLCDVLKRGVL